MELTTVARSGAVASLTEKKMGTTVFMTFLRLFVCKIIGFQKDREKNVAGTNEKW